jgi:hypothetical protein
MPISAAAEAEPHGLGGEACSARLGAAHGLGGEA